MVCYEDVSLVRIDVFSPDEFRSPAGIRVVVEHSPETCEKVQKSSVLIECCGAYPSKNDTADEERTGSKEIGCPEICEKLCHRYLETSVSSVYFLRVFRSSPSNYMKLGRLGAQV